MKIKKVKEYINESILDKMVGPDDVDIVKNVNKIDNLLDKLETIKKYNFEKYFPDYKSWIKDLDILQRVIFIKKYNFENDFENYKKWENEAKDLLYEDIVDDVEKGNMDLLISYTIMYLNLKEIIDLLQRKNDLDVLEVLYLLLENKPSKYISRERINFTKTLLDYLNTKKDDLLNDVIELGFYS